MRIGPPRRTEKLNLKGGVNMAGNNVNKDALVSAISEKTELSKKDIEMVLEAMIEVITKSLKSGDKVTMTGFGTFKVSNRAAREGINPQTKAKIQIPAMTVPKFSAGKALKEAIR